MRLGLFGGTFDPPHSGHLIVAQDACTALSLDRIVFVPAGAPPHKQNQRVTPAAARLAMLGAAIADDSRFEVDALELDRNGPSYTVDTVAAFRERHPGDEIFLLIGADQFTEFETWREPARIAELATVCVLSRDGAESPGDRLAAWNARWVPVTRVDISSTDIRGRCARGEPIRYRVPPGVESWLNENPIYHE